MDQPEVQIPTGLKKPPMGSYAGFNRLWDWYRAQIQSSTDPVALRMRGLHGLADHAQQLQNAQMRELYAAVEYAWHGELGEIWRFLGRIDLKLLEKQLGDLALIQADDLRKGSKKWETAEGVLNLLGELGDLLRRLAQGQRGKTGG